MTNTELDKLAERSGDPDLFGYLMEITASLMIKSGIKMNEAQQLSLASHLSAMVYRSLHKECIQSIDKELFSEVDPSSIKIAALICNTLPNLHEDEKFLLSIHFESATKN